MPDIILTDEEFNYRFKELVSAMAVTDKQLDLPDIQDKLRALSSNLRLTKGFTRIYADPAAEQLDIGETVTSFDYGKGGKPIYTVRVESGMMSVAKMTVYRGEDEPELNALEYERLDLIMRVAITFICRKKIQENAQHLAFYDDQGFKNARSFLRHLMWNRKPGAFDGMAAMNYNLRHFSLVNEKHGRRAGDMVLMNHYKYIENLAGENGIAARLGGDSFVCVFPQDNLADITAYLTRAEVPYDEEGNTVTVSANAGIFMIPDGFLAPDPNSVMGKILYACRVAETGGHDHIVFYNETLIEGRERAKRIQQLFPDALANKEFKVFFQPKVNTATGEICGAEALSRWFKDGRIVPPIEFIPVLERTSDICRLDFYVLNEVCGAVRRWLDEGRKVVRVSVNFSRKHFINENLLEDILEIVDRHNVPHEYVEIELTETTTDVEFKALKRIVRGLQENRICTSVDDFGMGYSSLNLIRVIPWNVLKVDRSFLPLDDEDPNSVRNIMFRNVVTMAREMGLDTLAEGVETPAQLCILRENRCDLAQGFLFDKPLPLDEFEKRMDIGRYDTY